MLKILIDNHELEIAEGERLNGIEAAARVGIDIPRYCWHPGLSVVASCRMCLVEYGTRDLKSGRVTMGPKVVPACQTQAVDGSVFITNSEKVVRARAMVEEDLLLRHPIDCPICDKAGECDLQDYHFEHGQSQRRADIRPFTSRRRDVGPEVTLFVDRCVLCSRCVRFTREITGTSELMIVGRGARAEIDAMGGFPLNNSLSGNVVDLCPVGALGDKEFLYKQRVWFLQRHAGVCTGCATGCSIWVEENQERIHRLKPRENPQINEWWICNEGRYGYPHVHDRQRLTTPQRRDGASVTAVDWRNLSGELGDRLRESGRLAAVVSPFLTVEEAYLLCKYVRAIDPAAVLALGPVPVVGEDERFPSGFTIRAEKCPNCRGVEQIIAGIARKVVRWHEFLDAVDAGEIRAAWISGGYKKPWNDEATAERLARLEPLIVQDLFPSPLSRRATYALPGAAFPERDGSYVNVDDHLQSVRRAIRPPAGVRAEGSLLWELSGRPGLYRAPAVLEEIAATIPYFAAASGGIGDRGVDMKVAWLTEENGKPDTTA
jgi:NADH-quinone oxidoreductase subunit G